MINYISLLGWLGVIITLIGYYLNANRNIYSWLLWIVGNTIIGLYSYLIEVWPTVFLSAVLIIINIYGYFNWKREATSLDPN